MMEILHHLVILSVLCVLQKKLDVLYIYIYEKWCILVKCFRFEVGGIRVFGEESVCAFPNSCPQVFVELFFTVFKLYGPNFCSKFLPKFIFSKNSFLSVFGGVFHFLVVYSCTCSVMYVT